MVNIAAHLSFIHCHAPRAGNNRIFFLIFFFFFSYLILFLKTGEKVQIVFLKADYEREQGANSFETGSTGESMAFIRSKHLQYKVQPVIP